MEQREYFIPKENLKHGPAMHTGSVLTAHHIKESLTAQQAMIDCKVNANTTRR
jgi:hypothetical protein